jgi:hypothetical protein
VVWTFSEPDTWRIGALFTADLLAIKSQAECRFLSSGYSDHSKQAGTKEP